MVKKEKNKKIVNLLKLPKPSTINICSREFDLIENEKTNGGYFNTYGKTGRGEISVGSKWKDKRYRFRVLFHETLEGILVCDEKRFEQDAKDNKYLFVFDHEYIDNLLDKIIDALLSCKAIEIKEF